MMDASIVSIKFFDQGKYLLGQHVVFLGVDVGVAAKTHYKYEYSANNLIQFKQKVDKVSLGKTLSNNIPHNPAWRSL